MEDSSTAAVALFRVPIVSRFFQTASPPRFSPFISVRIDARRFFTRRSLPFSPTLYPRPFLGIPFFFHRSIGPSNSLRDSLDARRNANLSRSKCEDAALKFAAQDRGRSIVDFTVLSSQGRAAGNPRRFTADARNTLARSSPFDARESINVPSVTRAGKTRGVKRPENPITARE